MSMPEILVTTPADPALARTIDEVAASLAVVLRAEVRTVGPRDGRSRPSARDVLHALAAPDSVLAILPGDPAPDALCWAVISEAGKPVVVVPSGAALVGDEVDRVLLPLDGTQEAAQAVGDAAALLADSGVDLIALHVFHDDDVPRFWDQAAHAGGAWCDEFLTRHLPAGSRLELRMGRPEEHVIDVATSEGVDLIVLGWSRSFAAGHARTVRRTVTDSTVPVLLCPVGDSRTLASGRTT
jgi:nucleotide-binding universal stress UspA family protein